MSAEVSLQLRVASPYPGLRPFRENEAHLFFGREKHIKQLREQLAKKRFLAVVGTSGSGKSSLVRAGLLASLRGDGDGAAERWRITELRPGRNPMLHPWPKRWPGHSGRSDRHFFANSKAKASTRRSKGTKPSSSPRYSVVRSG